MSCAKEIRDIAKIIWIILHKNSASIAKRMKRGMQRYRDIQKDIKSKCIESINKPGGKG